MFHAHIKILLINCFIVFSLTGCAVKEMKMTESGFLSGYSGLVEDDELEGMRVYKNPEINIVERYSKILIAPVAFKLDPTVKEHEMKYKDREKISDYFHKKLAEGLIENYEIVDEPGEGVILFRAAITDVLPSKVYLNLHWSTMLISRGGIGGASLEAELVDSVTNERILAFVDAKKGKSPIKQPKHLIKNYKSGLTKWGHTKEVLGNWAKIMVMNLDELREGYADAIDEDITEVKLSNEEKNF